MADRIDRSLLALNLITLLLDVFALDSVSGSTAFIYINEAYVCLVQ